MKLLNTAEVDSDLCFWLYNTGKPMPEEATFCLSKFAYRNLNFSDVPNVRNIHECTSRVSVNYSSWFVGHQIEDVDDSRSTAGSCCAGISVVTYICILSFEMMICLM